MNYSNIETFLTNIFTQAFNKLKLDTKYANVNTSGRPDLCQFQCNGALAIAKALQKNPMEVAEQIKNTVLEIEEYDINIGKLNQKISAEDLFKSLEICKPAFINITLTDNFLAMYSNELMQDKRFGCEKINPIKAVVDYGGPNAAKSMHVGHLRSGVVGDSIYRTMKFAGYDVIGDIHLGDWGKQMGMLIEAVRKLYPTLPYFDENFNGEYPKESPVTIEELEIMYPEASKLCKENEEEAIKARLATAELQKGRKGYIALWKHFVNVSIKSMKQNYANLGINFDLWKGESDVQPIIPAMIDDLAKRGIARKSEGALVIDVPAMESGQEVPPMILVKSDGGAIYATTDLATIKERVEELKAKEIVYVIDLRQNLHLYQVFEAAKVAGYANDIKLEFAGFGTVNGTDGKPFKTRSGGVMKLEDLIKMAKDAVTKRLDSIENDSRKFDESERDELIHKIAVATIKFADLANNRASGYIFDIEKFANFEGKTGPYLLYNAVRIKSILRKAKEKNINIGRIVAPTHNTERDLILLINQLPKYIERALNKKEPHHLCDFVFNLAQTFSKFYQNCHIMTEQNKELQESRLALSNLTLSAIELTLILLGIEVPERM